MSIILAQNLVRTGKSVEEAAKIAGVGEDMLRGLLGLPKKEVKTEPAITRTKATEGVKEELKKLKSKVAPEAIQSPKQVTKKEKKPKKRNFITQWCEKYPECFSRENPKPLKIEQTIQTLRTQEKIKGTRVNTSLAGDPKKQQMSRNISIPASVSI